MHRRRSRSVCWAAGRRLEPQPSGAGGVSRLELTHLPSRLVADLGIRVVQLHDLRFAAEAHAHELHAQDRRRANAEVSQEVRADVIAIVTSIGSIGRRVGICGSLSMLMWNVPAGSVDRVAGPTF